MMKQLLVMLMLLCSTVIFAQDVIVKKDGSTILAKVLEVNTDNIRYKKHSNPNGPTYTIGKSEIMSINYENGEEESYEYPETVLSAPINQYIEKAPDAFNSKLIEIYNRIYEPTSKVKKKDKIADRCFVLVGIKKSSIMSNEDMQMTFQGCILPHPKYGINCLCYRIKLKNNTNQNIYIDRNSCYRLSSDCKEFNYYSGYDNNMVSEKKNRYVTIPPHESLYFTEDIWEDGILVEENERFRFKYLPSDYIGLHKGAVKLGQIIVLNFRK